MSQMLGDVQCPTCGQWTPPAPFCSVCGAALQGAPGDAPPRDTANDPDVFRRGQDVAQPGSPWSPAERFEPEPEDEAARAAAAAGAASGAPRVDHFVEPEPAPRVEAPWPAEPDLVPPPPSAAPPTEPPASASIVPPLPREETPAEEPGPDAAAAAAAAAAVAATGAAAGAAGGGTRRRGRTKAAQDSPSSSAAGEEPTPPPPAAAPPPAVTPSPAPPPAVVPPPTAPPPTPPTVHAGASDSGGSSNGGVSGLVFVVFLGIGVLALLGGAILGGLFGGGTAEASPTPTPVVATPTPAPPTPEPSLTETPVPTSAPSVTPTVEPTAQPDGFIARVEVCDEQPSSPTCDNSGAVNDGNLWVLVSFRHAQATDVISVAILDNAGTTVDDGSLILSFCGTSTDCPGWTYFRFSNLDPGEYDVRVTRNGDPVGSTTFTVE